LSVTRRASRHLANRWTLLAAALIVLIVLAGLGAFAALRARSHGEAALAEVQYVQRNLLSASTRAGRADLESHLELARADSEAASSALMSTGVLRVVQWIPYLGGEVRGASTLFQDASTASTSGISILRALDTFQQHDAGGSISIGSLTTLQGKVASAAATLATLERPVGDLFGPVGHERAVFNRKVSRAVASLTDVTDALTVGRSIFGNGGTSTVLVLPENNAEMRDQGAILSYSLLRVHGTTISVGASGHSYDLNLPSPVDVRSSPGTRAYFYPDGAASNWRIVNAPADFSWSASTAAAMYKEATGTTVDDIVALDVPAMAALLGVTGPLVVPGVPGELTASNFSTVVLHDLYAAYPAGSQGPRYSTLDEIATALLRRIRSTSHDQVAYLRALAAQVPGRHLLLWSAQPTVERAIVHLGASGKVDTVQPGSTFHLANESAVADKMDYYIWLDEHFDVTLLANGGAQVATTLTIRNNAPAGQAPSYQLGPAGNGSTVPGQYISNSYLWSPSGSLVSGGVRESGLVLTGYSSSVLPQHATKVYFFTTLPRAVAGGRFVIHLVPQPMLNPVLASVSVHGPGWTVSGPRASPFTLGSPETLTYEVGR
jgi:hypothetical protein